MLAVCMHPRIDWIIMAATDQVRKMRGKTIKLAVISG